MRFIDMRFINMRCATEQRGGRQMAKILVVEDDHHIRDVICFALEKAGHEYRYAQNGREGFDLFLAQEQAQPFDLIVLDIGLPEMDGLDLCREIRKISEVPILFLSARDEEVDRILGLEIGGDDYVTKPFSPRELIARIRVILKRISTSQFMGPGAGASTGASASTGTNAGSRAGAQLNSPEENIRFTQGALELDASHRSLYFAGQSVQLTSIEFEILKTILARPKLTFTREQIMSAAYPANIHVSNRTIDSHVRNIRAKLSEHGCAEVIETVHGFGFRLGPCLGTPSQVN